MGKLTKRPKQFYIQQNKKFKTELLPNSNGFLCIYNNNKSRCIYEAKTLLNAAILKVSEEKQEISDLEIAKVVEDESEKKYDGKTENEDDSDSEDFDKELQKEIDEKKPGTSTNKSKILNFKKIHQVASSVLFIESEEQELDSLKIVLEIMNEIKRTGQAKTRELIKVLPIHSTCKAYPENIEKSVKSLVEEKFPKTKVTYYIIFKIRNNNSFDKDPTVSAICKIISDYNSEAVAEFKIPDLVLHIDIIKNMCFLSLLPEFMTTFSKYNLIQIAHKNTSNIEEEKVDL